MQAGVHSRRPATTVADPPAFSEFSAEHGLCSSRNTSGTAQARNEEQSGALRNRRTQELVPLFLKRARDVARDDVPSGIPLGKTRDAIPSGIPLGKRVINHSDH